MRDPRTTAIICRVRDDDSDLTVVSGIGWGLDDVLDLSGALCSNSSVDEVDLRHIDRCDAVEVAAAMISAGECVRHLRLSSDAGGRFSGSSSEDETTGRRERPPPPTDR